MAQNYVENCFDQDNPALTDLQNIESNLHCLKTHFSGSSTPPDTTVGVIWADTGTNWLRVRRADNAGWNPVIDLSTGSYGGAAAKVQRTVTAGSGLTGGGMLVSDVTVSVASSGITETMIASSAVTASKIANGAITAAKLPVVARVVHRMGWQFGRTVEGAKDFSVNKTPTTKDGFYVYKTSDMSNLYAVFRGGTTKYILYARLYHSTAGAGGSSSGLIHPQQEDTTGTLDISGLDNNTLHWIRLQFWSNSESTTAYLYDYIVFAS